MKYAIEEIRHVRNYNERVDLLQYQLLPILFVVEPMAKAFRRCKSIGIESFFLNYPARRELPCLAPAVGRLADSRRAVAGSSAPSDARNWQWHGKELGPV